MGFFGNVAKKKRKFDVWNENRKERAFIHQGRELHRLRRNEEVMGVKSNIARHKANIAKQKAEQRRHAGMAFRSHFGGMSNSGLGSSIFDDSIFGRRHTRRGRR